MQAQEFNELFYEKWDEEGQPEAIVMVQGPGMSPRSIKGVRVEYDEIEQNGDTREVITVLIEVE